MSNKALSWWGTRLPTPILVLVKICFTPIGGNLLLIPASMPQGWPSLTNQESLSEASPLMSVHLRGVGDQKMLEIPRSLLLERSTWQDLRSRSSEVGGLYLIKAIPGSNPVKCRGDSTPDSCPGFIRVYQTHRSTKRYQNISKRSVKNYPVK